MLLHRFLPRTEFDSYEDFKANYKVNIPEDFNFGFDVVDAWAEADKNKKALVWCNDHGEEKTFTFSDISRLSNKTANYFRSLGIKKGDVVMMILRRRWEYWICATALHKVGAVLIPGSLQLTKKDIVYRGNSAEVKAIICVNDDFVINQARLAQPCRHQDHRADTEHCKRSVHNAPCCVRVLFPAEDREERCTAGSKEIAEGCDDDNDRKT